MKLYRYISCKYLLTGILLLTVCHALSAATMADSLLLERLFSYRRNFAAGIEGQQSNMYMRYSFRIIKRNPTLLFVPSMYYVARGQRNHVGEIYGKVTFRDFNDYDIDRQLMQTTIPHKKNIMSALIPYVTPNLYGVSIYNDMILSPFNSANRIFYQYRVSMATYGRALVTFNPKLHNTQLITGYALVDLATGRIVNTRFRGEHDMIRFNNFINMGDDNNQNIVLPQESTTEASFNFLGNKIKATVRAFYHQQASIEDSIHEEENPTLMALLRPQPLTIEEHHAYTQFINQKAQADSDTLARKKKKSLATQLRRIAWDVLGDHLINSLSTSSANASVKMSPLLNPLYLSYSHSRGLAYRLDLGAHYSFSSNQILSLTPNLGYNFKIRQFYFQLPLRYTYNTKRDGWIELNWANGNRITNSSVLDKIRDEHRDTIDFASLNLDYFHDELWRLTWNTQLNRQFKLRAGTVYHRRTAVNRNMMEEAGKPSQYKTFAASLALSYTPMPTGPVLTGNYERSLKHILQSNTEYERWEFDASYKKQLQRLRNYSLRLGGGFYTNKSSDFFVDFENFHENYLPGGWDDDWSGDFQLLNSQWYNASHYYIRFNATYESPLMISSHLPFVGRFIETERIYASALRIEHTRPYFELGYGFTTRYFSAAVFGSFLNGSIHEAGCKFTLELFSKW